mgnify:CR=1 FL=1
MLISAAGTTITAVNAAVNLSKLLQISCGAVYSDTKEVVEFDAAPRLGVLEEILEETNRKVIVFEKEPGVGRHQTGHNSGVLHCGLYYKPGSLKARLAVRGIRLMTEFCREHEIWLVHDLAYADIVFDGYKAPSFLQVPGAKDIGVEFYTLSKAYNMPGWRVGFCVGNREVVGALAKIKSYLDYGIFQPVQIASVIALNGPQDCVKETVLRYQKRRDVLVGGLNRIGWNVAKPLATMFVWARIPLPYRHMGSLEFSKLLLKEAKVAVSPGIGFGEGGDEYVRFGLVENEHRTRQAVRGIRKALKLDGAEE